MPSQRLTLSLDPDLAVRLELAASETGLSREDLTLRCLRDGLGGVAAYGRVADELGLIKTSLMELAGLVGEALAEPDERSVGEICRYKPPKVPRA